MIIKDDAQGLPPRRERFDADKLRQGIQIACAKRPIPPSALDRLVESIEARLIDSHQSEVSSRRIGEMVITGLRDLDEIAYLRYAMVFLRLDDLASVRREIDRLVDSQAEKDRDGLE
jgi:transcriptional repressor NrdR